MEQGANSGSLSARVEARRADLFLHNEVETIQRMAAQVAELAPGARIAVAHGQMRERELEQVMLDFYHRRCNLLICTTIIESGIDVPSANTIIINRADKLGLAQLHQLRGRVGRSHHRAYAYLIVPPRPLMTADAIKRIEAIESLEDLGAGFHAGQSRSGDSRRGRIAGRRSERPDSRGRLHLVYGFAGAGGAGVESRTRAGTGSTAGSRPGMDLQSPALIPDDYLPDVHSRLILYKRIASARDERRVAGIAGGDDRPLRVVADPVKTLFRVTELKLRALPIGVKKIEAGPKGGRIVFGPKPKVDAG
jgi:transcription-repair coupling factor (superfamily II helicase)